MSQPIGPQTVRTKPLALAAGWTTSTRAVLNLLASRGLIERPKAGA